MAFQYLSERLTLVALRAVAELRQVSTTARPSYQHALIALVKDAAKRHGHEAKLAINREYFAALAAVLDELPRHTRMALTRHTAVALSRAWHHVVRHPAELTVRRLVRQHPGPVLHHIVAVLERHLQARS